MSVRSLAIAMFAAGFVLVVAQSSGGVFAVERGEASALPGTMSAGSLLDGMFDTIQGGGGAQDIIDDIMDDITLPSFPGGDDDDDVVPGDDDDDVIPDDDDDVVPGDDDDEGGQGTQCPADVNVCPDGTLVHRDPNLDCAFAPCPEPKQECSLYFGELGFERVCATCGDSVCEAYEQCTPSRCFAGRCSDDCGDLYCPRDCEPKEEPICGNNICEEGEMSSCDESCVGDGCENECVLGTCPEDCEFAAVACSLDTQLCPDGSSVGRSAALDCEFAECPDSVDHDGPTFICPRDAKLCPDGSTVGRSVSLDCGYPPCPVAAVLNTGTRTLTCVEESMVCADGTSVARNPNLGCAFDPCPEIPADEPAVTVEQTTSITCTRDVRMCSDGSAVTRNPSRSCDFDPCPQLSISILPSLECPQDSMLCSDGSMVYRNPLDRCHFDDCPQPACAQEVRVCPDGSTAQRNPANNCEFDAC